MRRLSKYEESLYRGIDTREGGGVGGVKAVAGGVAADGEVVGFL